MADDPTKQDPPIEPKQDDPPAPPSDEEREAELTRLRAALKAANSESAERRKKIEKYEQAEAERQQAEMSELEKERKAREEAERRAQAAEESAKQTLVRAAFVAEAARAGVAHPEDVYLLADKSSVTVADDGTVEGVTEAVKVLVDAGRVPLAGRPQAPNLDGGAGGGQRSNGGKSVKLSDDEVETARRMGVSVEKYAAQKAAMAQESAQ